MTEIFEVTIDKHQSYNSVDSHAVGFGHGSSHGPSSAAHHHTPHTKKLPILYRTFKLNYDFFAKNEEDDSPLVEFTCASWDRLESFHLFFHAVKETYFSFYLQLLQDLVLPTAATATGHPNSPGGGVPSGRRSPSPVIFNHPNFVSHNDEEEEGIVERKKREQAVLHRMKTLNKLQEEEDNQMSGGNTPIERQNGVEENRSEHKTDSFESRTLYHDETKRDSDIPASQLHPMSTGGVASSRPVSHPRSSSPPPTKLTPDQEEDHHKFVLHKVFLQFLDEYTRFETRYFHLIFDKEMHPFHQYLKNERRKKNKNTVPPVIDSDILKIKKILIHYFQGCYELICIAKEHDTFGDFTNLHGFHDHQLSLCNSNFMLKLQVIDDITMKETSGHVISNAQLHRASTNSRSGRGYGYPQHHSSSVRSGGHSNGEFVVRANPLSAPVGTTILCLYLVSASNHDLHIDHVSWQQLKHTDFSDHTYAHLVSTLNRVAPQTSSHSPLNKLSKYFCLEVHDNVIPTLQWCRYFEIPLRQDFLSSTDLHLCDRFVFPQKGNLLEILIRFPAHPNHPTVTSVGVLNATNTATSPLISASSSTPPSNTSLISPFLNTGAGHNQRLHDHPTTTSYYDNIYKSNRNQPPNYFEIFLAYLQRRQTVLEMYLDDNANYILTNISSNGFSGKILSPKRIVAFPQSIVGFRMHLLKNLSIPCEIYYPTRYSGSNNKLSLFTDENDYNSHLNIIKQLINKYYDIIYKRNPIAIQLNYKWSEYQLALPPIVSLYCPLDLGMVHNNGSYSNLNRSSSLEAVNGPNPTEPLAKSASDGHIMLNNKDYKNNINCLVLLKPRHNDLDVSKGSGGTPDVAAGPVSQLPNLECHNNVTIDLPTTDIFGEELSTIRFNHMNYHLQRNKEDGNQISDLYANYIACFCTSSSNRTNHHYVAAAYVSGKVKVRCLMTEQTFSNHPANKKTFDPSRYCPYPTSVAMHCSAQDPENLVAVGNAAGYVLLYYFNDFTYRELILLNSVHVPMCLEQPRDWITVLHIYNFDNVVIGTESGHLFNWFDDNRNKIPDSYKNIGPCFLNETLLHCNCNHCIAITRGTNSTTNVAGGSSHGLGGSSHGTSIKVEPDVKGLSLFEHPAIPQSNSTTPTIGVSATVSYASLKRQITCIDACHDRGIIAVGSFNRTVTLWLVGKSMKRNKYLCTHRKILELTDHRSGISSVVVSKSGALVYAGEYDGSIAVWDAIMGSKLRTIHDAYRLPCQLFQTPRDIRYFADTSSALFEREIDHDKRRIKTLALSDDGSLMTAVFASGHVVFLDAHVSNGTHSDEDLRSMTHYDFSSKKSIDAQTALTNVNSTTATDDYALLNADSLNLASGLSGTDIRGRGSNQRRGKGSAASSTGSGGGSVGNPATAANTAATALASFESQNQRATLFRSEGRSDSIQLTLIAPDESSPISPITPLGPSQQGNNIRIQNPKKLYFRNNYYYYQGWEYRINDIVVSESYCLAGRSKAIQLMNLKDSSIQIFEVVVDENESHDDYDDTAPPSLQGPGLQPPLTPHRSHRLDMDITRNQKKRPIDNEIKLMKSRYSREIFCIHEKTVFNFKKTDLLNAIKATDAVTTIEDDKKISSCLIDNMESYRYSVCTITSYGIEKETTSAIVLARRVHVTDGNIMNIIFLYVRLGKEALFEIKGMWETPVDAGMITCVSVSLLGTDSSHVSSSWSQPPNPTTPNPTNASAGSYVIVAGTKSGGVFVCSYHPTMTTDILTTPLLLTKPLYSHLKIVNTITIEDMFILSGSDDFNIKIFDLINNYLIDCLKHNQEVTCLTICPITSILLVGCSEDCVYVWFWSSSAVRVASNSQGSNITDIVSAERLGVIKQSNLRRSDYVSSIAYSECEQIYLTTSNDRKRLKIHRHVMTDDFHRIHNLAIMKKRGYTMDYARLPVNTDPVLNFIIREDYDHVKQLCLSNPREVRELLLLLGKYSFYDHRTILNKHYIDRDIAKMMVYLSELPITHTAAGSSKSNKSNSNNKSSSYQQYLYIEDDNNYNYKLMRNYKFLTCDRIQLLVETLPHFVMLKISKYGNFLDTMLALKQQDYVSLSNGYVSLLLNVYSFLLGAKPSDVNLNIDEQYWKLNSCKQTFTAYNENHSKYARLQSDFIRPFCDMIDINKVIELCDQQHNLYAFARFVTLLKPLRNYDAMIPLTTSSTRIPHSVNYLLRGSYDYIVPDFWKRCNNTNNNDTTMTNNVLSKSESTSSDVVIPMYIPLKNIAARKSRFLHKVVSYTEFCNDYSLLRNSVVKIIIAFKWQEHVKNRFFVDFIILVIWNILIVIMALLNRRYFTSLDTNLFNSIFILRIIVIILLSRFMLREVLEFILKAYHHYSFLQTTAMYFDYDHSDHEQQQHAHQHITKLNNGDTIMKDRSSHHGTDTDQIMHGIPKDTLRTEDEVEEPKKHHLPQKQWNTDNMIRSLKYATSKYCGQMDNLADACVCIGLIIALEFQRRALFSGINRFQSDDINESYALYTNNAFAALMPLLGLNLLYDLRCLDYVGSNISMMMVMIQSSLSLLLILAVMIFCFAASFMLVCSNDRDFHTFNKSIVMVYSYVFGAFNFEEMYSSVSPRLAVILLIVFLFIVSIILLNLLIAIMGSSQEKMNDLIDEAVLLARAELIEQYENLTLRWGLNHVEKAKDFPQWKPDMSKSAATFENVGANNAASSKSMHSANSDSGRMRSMFGRVLGRMIDSGEMHGKTISVRNDINDLESKRVNSSRFVGVVGSNQKIVANRRFASLLDDESEKVPTITNTPPLNDKEHNNKERRGSTTAATSTVNNEKEEKESTFDESCNEFWFKVFRILVFLFTSISIINEKQEKERFPRYIQILAKDGFSFDEVNVKNPNSSGDKSVGSGSSGNTNTNKGNT